MTTPTREQVVHPTQPLVTDQHGVVRFKENKIVSFLSEGRLNELACMDFSVEDHEQVAQLIGYSLSGFGSLSYVTDETFERAQVARADLEATIAEQAAEIERLKAQKTVFVPVSNETDRYDNHPNDNQPRSDDLRHVFLQMGDDTGQGLSPYWKWAFATGWNLAKTNEDQLRQQLAAQQAYAEQLREFIANLPKLMCECGKIFKDDSIADYLSIPHDTTALQEYGAKLVERVIDSINSAYHGPLVHIPDKIRKGEF